MKKLSNKTDEPELDMDLGAASMSMSMAPDGLPQIPVLEQPAKAPPAHPDTFICLRGPCENYWYLETDAGAGNPTGTWEHLGVDEPRLRHHSCRAQPGYVIDFEDDCAYDCNLWTPVEPDVLADRLARRGRYFDEHPEHRPAEYADIEDEETDDA